MAGETLVSSRILLAEFEEKLVTKANLPPTEAAVVRAEVEAEMHIVLPGPLPVPVCRDPDDDVVLATAQAGNVEAIVTGDRDLLVLGHYLGIPIITPAECAAMLGGV